MKNRVIHCALGIDQRNQFCLIENPTEAELGTLKQPWEFWIWASRTVYTAHAQYSNIRELVTDYKRKINEHDN